MTNIYPLCLNVNNFLAAGICPACHYAISGQPRAGYTEYLGLQSPWERCQGVSCLAPWTAALCGRVLPGMRLVSPWHSVGHHHHHNVMAGHHHVISCHGIIIITMSVVETSLSQFSITSSCDQLSWYHHHNVSCWDIIITILHNIIMWSVVMVSSSQCQLLRHHYHNSP